MDFEFWDNCWQRDSQPFHVAEEHPLLARNLKYLNSKEKLLLPLSGKSVDPLFLAEQGFNTTAIEFNPKAVTAFLTDNQLMPKEQKSTFGIHYQLEKIDIWLADFFTLTHQQIGLFSQVFDRASLVALPLELREKFVEHLKSLLKPQTKILMVTMDYNPELMDGPPFYLSVSDLRDYFPTAQIKELDRHSLLSNHSRWQELKLGYLDEVLYQIQL